MNFRKELARELNLGAIAEETMLQDYIIACEAIAVKYHKEQVKKLHLHSVSKCVDVERGHSVCCTKCGKSLKPIYMCTACVDTEMQNKLKQTDC